MILAEPRTRPLNSRTQAGPLLGRAGWDYVRAHVRLYGQGKTAEVLGVSRHTLWRFLERGQLGRVVPSAVLNSVGGSTQAIKAATPLATVEELSRFGRLSASTLRDRLTRLTERGLVDSVPHQLSVLGTHPQRRYFPTDKGVIAGGMATKGRNHMLRAYPVSKQWFRLLAERLDAVAVLHCIAAMVADADPHSDPMRVDLYRNDPYDMLLTLSGGRSIGVIRQGPALPTSKLRYRLRSIERLDSDDRSFVTLVMSHADQATRRAVRSLGDPSEHRRTFVATEGELLAGDHTGVVWQQCGSGVGEAVRIDADASLRGILAWSERLLETSYSFLQDSSKADPGVLYPSGVQAAMPEPIEQLTPALSVQLSRAEKDALDLLSAWPLSTREQLEGLMGSVTLRRVNQVLHSLSLHGLVRTDDPLHMLTDEGLTYLARRDRAAVGLILDQWSTEPLYPNSDIYAGTAVRALASQLRHHAGVIDFASALSAEVANSPDHDLWDLLPTSRSSIGYRYNWNTYVIHPDASFTLKYQGRWCPYLLEFERRATTPKRTRPRLKSYRRYFASGWAERDHKGRLPRVLFVFESSDNEKAFLDVADTVEGLSIITSNTEALEKHGILGKAWIIPPPYSLDRRPLAALDQGTP